MIRSMTGFGRGEYSDEKRTVTCEIRSVNHRYSDINVKMPRRYMFAEEYIKNIIKETVHRGKVEVSVIIDNSNDDDIKIRLSEGTARQYYERLCELNEKFSLGGNVSLEMLASMPDVMKPIPCVEDEEGIKQAIGKSVREAAENHNAMRTTEGEKLKNDLVKRGSVVRELISSIAKRAPRVSEEYGEKLRERIKELTEGTAEIPEDRIAVEAAIFADKANITEELVRLDSHVSQMDQILSGDSPCGKKLDFLIQEMNREANTIGSKANDLNITNDMLELKSEVEKIREQVQNIE